MKGRWIEVYDFSQERLLGLTCRRERDGKKDTYSPATAVLTTPQPTNCRCGLEDWRFEEDRQGHARRELRSENVYGAEIIMAGPQSHGKERFCRRSGA